MSENERKYDSSDFIVPGGLLVDGYDSKKVMNLCILISEGRFTSYDLEDKYFRLLAEKGQLSNFLHYLNKFGNNSSISFCNGYIRQRYAFYLQNEKSIQEKYENDSYLRTYFDKVCNITAIRYDTCIEMYRNICANRFNLDNFDRYFDRLNEKGELRKFVRFMDGFLENKWVDFPEFKYIDGDPKLYLKYFMADLKKKYAFYIEKEREVADYHTYMSAKESQIKENEWKRKVEKYIDDLKDWNNKSSLWKSMNLKKKPQMEKYGVTVEDLEKYGFYDPEAKLERMTDYKMALAAYMRSSKIMKQYVPIPEDYHLTHEDEMSYDADYSVKAR